MKRCISLFVVFIVACLLSAAQTEKIARIREQIRSSGKEARLEQELRLLEEHESLFKDSLMPVAWRTFAEAEETGIPELVVQASIGLIHACLRNDNVRAADSLIDAQLKHATDERAKLRLQLEKATTLASRADYAGSVKMLFAVVESAEHLKDYATLGRAFNELGVISYNRNELPQALDYYRKALSYAGPNQTAAYAYINIAMVHGWQEHYDSALHYLGLAKPLCEKTENLYYLANAYAVEANVYKWSGRLKEAERAMLEMVKLREKTEGRITFSNEQLSLANFYVYAKDYQKAIAIYRDGLSYAYAHQTKAAPVNYEFVLHYYEGLAKCFLSTDAKAEYEQALRHIIELKDTLSERNSADAIAEMQTQYEVQKKENTIIAQKLDITRKNVLFYGSLLLTGIAVLIGWLLFRGFRRKSMLELEEEKRHAAQAVRDAEEAERRRIAADLHDSLGSYAASIKSNADEMKRNQQQALPVLDLLQTNAQQMVSLLADTIWAMRRDRLRLSDISDRVKLVLQRLRPNYPAFSMRVDEDLGTDVELPPVQAYHLFMIIQEAVNNALRHSSGSRVVITFRSGPDWSVSVADNGVGMRKHAADADGGNGLPTMQSRASSMGCSIEWLRAEPNGTAVLLKPTSN